MNKCFCGVIIDDNKTACDKCLSHHHQIDDVYGE